MQFDKDKNRNITSLSNITVQTL